MFDIGFSELLVIGVVALIVIGPERLPRVARTAGHLYGRFQRYVSDVKMDINREMHLEELRKMQDELKSSVNSLEQSVHSELNQGTQAVQEVAEQIHEIIEIPHQGVVAESAPAPDPVSLSPNSPPEGFPPPNPPPQAGEGANEKSDGFDLRDVVSLRESHANEKTA